MKYLFLALSLMLGLILSSVAVSNEYSSQKLLKNLFTTPYERQQLDNSRNSDGNESNIVNKALNHAASVDLKGIVYRKGKQPVIWVNESNTLKNKMVDSNIRVYGLDSKNIVRLKVNKKKIKMKPGQVWSEMDDQAIDKYRMKLVE